MTNKVQRTQEQQRKLDLLIRNLPRCKECGQALIATCDRSKPSELVEFKGIKWTKGKPQFMMFYPTAEEQSKLCPYCENKLYPAKIGKES